MAGNANLHPMNEQPWATVTFLFTGIEGSTSRWEADPEAMRQALARHDSLLREVLERIGGRVFKTRFCAAFAAAVAAVQAALAAQGALGRESAAHPPHALRVPIALQRRPSASSRCCIRSCREISRRCGP